MGREAILLPGIALVSFGKFGSSVHHSVHRSVHRSVHYKRLLNRRVNNQGARAWSQVVRTGATCAQ